MCWRSYALVFVSRLHLHIHAFAHGSGSVIVRVSVWMCVWGQGLLVLGNDTSLTERWMAWHAMLVKSVPLKRHKVPPSPTHKSIEIEKVSRVGLIHVAHQCAAHQCAAPPLHRLPLSPKQLRQLHRVDLSEVITVKKKLTTPNTQSPRWTGCVGR